MAFFFGGAAPPNDSRFTKALGFRVSGFNRALAALVGRLSEAAGYENILESEWSLEQWSVTEQFLLVVVLAPLFEELIYRLPLLKLAFDLL